MARNNLIPLVAGCLTLAALFCLVAAKTNTYEFTLYQQMNPEDEVEVWNSAKSKMPGVVYNNKCTKTADPESEIYGTLEGAYWTIFSTKQSQILNELASLKFKDIGQKGGTFADAVIHLRSQWYANGKGEDYSQQQASIVGGTRGLAGAYGNVTYTQQKNKTTFRIDGRLCIDS